MIVHQTEKIAGSTNGCLEDGCNDGPKTREGEREGNGVGDRKHLNV